MGQSIIVQINNSLISFKKKKDRQTLEKRMKLQGWWMSTLVRQQADFLCLSR